MIALLQRDAIPIALDVWYEQRREDAAGDFYLRIAKQRDGYDPEKTTQGFYICDAKGELLSGWNNRDPAKLLRNLQSAVANFQLHDAPSLAADNDARFARKPPEHGAVVDVFARILEANWPPAKDEWQEKFRTATGRDHLWITGDDLAALARGEFAPALAERLFRFNLVDNTRGEPPMWTRSEIREQQVHLSGGALSGHVRLANEDGSRGFDALLAGRIETTGGALTRFDVVARGEFWGEGMYTQHAPPGRFVLGIAFRLAPPGTASAVPPQGARDLSDYLGRGVR